MTRSWIYNCIRSHKLQQVTVLWTTAAVSIIAVLVLLLLLCTLLHYNLLQYLHIYFHTYCINIMHTLFLQSWLLLCTYKTNTGCQAYISRSIHCEDGLVNATISTYLHIYKYLDIYTRPNMSTLRSYPQLLDTVKHHVRT